jgi:hypothetical protein
MSRLGCFFALRFAVSIFSFIGHSSLLAILEVFKKTGFFCFSFKIEPYFLGLRSLSNKKTIGMDINVSKSSRMKRICNFIVSSPYETRAGKIAFHR